MSSTSTEDDTAIMDYASPVPPPKASQRIILLNSASSVLAAMVNMSVVVWITQHLLRRISPEEYQVYPVVTAIMVFMPLLTVILTAGLGRYIVEAYARGDNQRVTEICSTMFVPLLCVCLLILGAGSLLVWKIDHILRIAPDQVHSARIMLALLLFVAAVRLPLAPFGVGLYVRQRFILQNAVGLACDFLKTGLLLVLILGVGPRVIWVVVSITVADLAYLVIRLILSCRAVPGLRFRRSHINWQAAKGVTWYGFWMILTQVANGIRMSLGPLLLNRFSHALDVTVFDVGSRADGIISRASYMACEPLQPALTAAHATEDHGRIQRAFLRGCRYSLWCSLAMAVPLMIFGKPLITLYVGKSFLTAATVMTLLLLPYPLIYGSILVDQLAWAKAAMKAWAPRTLAIQLGNLALAAVFVVGLKMGAVGAALATCLALGIGIPVLMWPLGMRLAGVSWAQWTRKTLLPGVAPALAALAVGLVLHRTVDTWTWTTLAACVAATLLSHGCALLMFCLDSEERQMLNSVAKRVLAQEAVT